MLEYKESDQELLRKRKISVRCPTHHVKYNLGMGCPECNRTNNHKRPYIASNVIWQKPTESE